MKFLFSCFIICFTLISQAQEVVGEFTEIKPTEEQIAARYIIVDGKKLRVVGGATKEEAKVEDNELGRAVEVLPTDSDECSIIFEAQDIIEDTIYSNGSNRLIPNLPDIKDILTKHSYPVQISGSCAGTTCLWNSYMRGEDCRSAILSSGYFLSSMKEALELPLDKKQRLLVIEGICEDKDKNTYNCTVPYGDVRAKADGLVSIPHSWSGRAALNFAKGKNDEAVLKYTVEDFKEAKAIEAKIIK